MAKFEGGYLDHAGFLAIKEKLTAALATAIHEHLESLGDDAKGISWFSSTAEQHVFNKARRAA